ncbi:hypothetical protein B9T31_07250 [Acinetobacter sp. ANC 4558]|uniref:DUF2938 family protein n=1 Tax=Acinetobacter sp. ANC 4558 TaxID=1977876 RepID=UPI000A32C506|nr:DUF2938 family protein [Acinetobacter sp. ANC 4558]OTG86778.1 hypothetical protein B9T31_07250 [Acinetobacter sp. ANC 4558]
MLFFMHTIAIGILATIFMDIFSILNQKIFKIIPLNYALIGRWVLSWKNFKFSHNTILNTSAIKHELCVGWLIHYATGIGWTYLYFISSTYFNYEINLLNTLIFALITTLFPFIILQPVLGFGIFAQKTPNPLKSIRNSLIAHSLFGLGLYYAYRLCISIY